MAAGDIALRVLITGSAESAIGAFSSVAAAGSGLASSFALVGGIAAAGIAVAAVAAVKMAADFQSSVTRLYTTAGEFKSNLGMVSAGILAMAGEVGIGAQKLVDAMYWVESAGFHGQQGLDVLRIAAMGAKAENSDLIPVAHALTGVLNTYASTGITAAQAMNVLIASTGQGAMTLAQLSGAISNVLPAANKFHLQLIDITTGIATMTNQNDNAASAATHLRQVILALESPAKAGAKALAEIGLTTQQVSDAMKKSLPDAIQMIITDLGKRFPEGSAAYNDALKAIAGGNKQLLGLLELSGGSLAKWKASVLAVKNAVDQGGNSIMGWSDIQGNFNFKMDQAKAALGSLAIMLGSNLLPLITPLVANIGSLITSFTKWANSGHALNDALSLNGKYAQIALPILSALAVVVGVGLAIAFWNLAAAVIAATWPVLAVAAAVAALVAIFIALYQHNAGFKAFIDNLVSWFKGTLIPALQTAWNWISSVFVAGWKAMVAWFQGTFLPAMRAVGQWFMATIWPVMVQIGQYVAAAFIPVWQQLVSTWNSQLLPAFKAMGQVIQNQVWPVLQQLWGVIQKNLWPALQQLWPVLKVIGMIIGGIVAVAVVLLIGVIAGLVRAIGTLISGIIQFVGGVIQFFAGLWETVSGIVALIVDLCTGHFSKLGADLQQIWSGIQNMWSGLWAAASGIVQIFVGTIESYVQGFFTTVVGIFTNLYNKLVGHSIIPDLINGAISWFSQLLGKPVSFVANMVSNLLGKFGDLASQGIAKIASFVSGIAGRFGQAAHDAVNWGAGIVNAILRGLQNAWAAVTSWLGGALAGIRNMFPHSPVKEGPLMGLENWGGNIVGNLVASMHAATPQLTAAANSMALAVNGPLGSSGFAVRGGSFALSGNSTVVVQVQAGDINLDKRKVGQILFNHQASEIRKQGSVRNH